MTNLRLTSIQILRGLAAVWVVIFHAMGLVPQGESINPGIAYIGHYGNYGVDIFFVLSGFVIFYSVYGRKMSPKDFFIRRAERIIPPYLLLTTVLAIAMLVVPSAFSTKSASLMHFLASATYLSFTSYEYPVLYVGWSLEYEMFFYVLAAGALALGYRFFARLPIAICAIVLFGIAFAKAELSSAAVAFLTSPSITEFALGMFIASVFLTKKIDKHMAGVLLATLILVLLTSPEHRLISAGIPSAALIYICLATNDRVTLPLFLRAPLISLGDASYSIYLIQVFTLPVSAKLLRPFSNSINPTMITVAEIGITIFAGWLFFRFVESPILNCIRAKRSSDRSATAAA